MNVSPKTMSSMKKFHTMEAQLDAILEFYYQAGGLPSNRVDQLENWLYVQGRTPR